MHMLHLHLVSASPHCSVQLKKGFKIPSELNRELTIREKGTGKATRVKIHPRNVIFSSMYA